MRERTEAAERDLLIIEPRSSSDSLRIGLNFLCALYVASIPGVRRLGKILKGVCVEREEVEEKQGRKGSRICSGGGGNDH